MNQVWLRGKVSAQAVFSHQAHQTRLYRLELEAMRLSGACDGLRVLLSEELLRGLDPCVGDSVEIRGQMRSYNNKSGQGSRLVISALARHIGRCDGAPMNRTLLAGWLCKTPVFRRTPFGREICDIMLAVPRTYNRADYLPLIAWGQTARICARMAAGDRLFAEGRFQSRGYTKIEDGAAREKVAFEISVGRLLESEEELVSLASDMAQGNVLLSEAFEPQGI